MIAYLLKKFPRLPKMFVLNELLGQESFGREPHVFSRRERISVHVVDGFGTAGAHERGSAGVAPILPS